MSEFGDTRLPPRFWTKVAVNDETGCWEWTAALAKGYGRFGVGARASHTVVQAHRHAYEALRGPVDRKMECDHLCRNRRCVNPAHIEVVSHRVNSLRGDGAPALNAEKTHCKRGHEFAGDNLRITIKQGPSGPKLGRECVTCMRMHGRIADRKRRGRVRRRSGHVVAA